MLTEILKEALRLMKKSLNLTQLIFIFFIIMTIFTPLLAGIKLNFKIIPVAIVLYGLICAFWAGIFFAFKKSLEYDKTPPKTNDPLELPPLYFTEFLQGIGRYIIKFLYGGLVVVGFLSVIVLLYSYIVHNFVGIPQKFIDAVSNNVLSSDAKLMEFFNSLTVQEQSQMGKISLLTLCSICLFSYATMLYPVVIVSKEENFIKCFFASLKSLFKNIPVSLILFLFFNFLLTFLGMLGAAFVNNIFISVFAILLQCYLNVWYILSLFVYYEKTK